MAAVLTKSKQDKINKQQFEALCNMQCTQVEICSVFNCCEDTLNAWCKNNYDGKTFLETRKMFSEKGKASIRRMQFKSAENGNVTMQVWLGKQYLGQTDKIENTNMERVTIVNDINPTSNR